MRVPDELRKSIVFVGYRRNENPPDWAGTAFIISVEPEGSNIFFGYLVTAKHVIVGIQQISSDNKVYIRINHKEGGYLVLECQVSDWVYHPDEPSTDVAVTQFVFQPEAGLDYMRIPHTMIATGEIIEREGIGIGDEVFLSGLFVNHFGQNRNLPIVRTGNIALMPEEPIASRYFGNIEAYLIEARSIGGLSGSPVFVHLPAIRVSDGQASLTGSPFYLLGLIHGHWDLPVSNVDVVVQDDVANERVNMGIAIVIPATKIMETINHPIFVAIRERDTPR